MIALYFKVASFNINSVRARKEMLIQWLGENKPDVVCLQETKVINADFPAASFLEAGYNSLFKGRKSYNGVAILSPHQINPLISDLGPIAEPDEARLIAAEIRGIPIVNTYIPQGQSPESDKFSYKIFWIKALKEYFDANFKPDEPLLWLGDFNVAPEPEDVHAPKRLLGRVGFHPTEHEALDYVKSWGFKDIFRLHHQSEGGHFTFWDYRVPKALDRNLGWRIDHIWATDPLAKRSTKAWIDIEPRRRENLPTIHLYWQSLK
ncbi:hypothetical protein N752_18225 [Desulforamulus aquiferis]|nr:exodeoxyribonuclease III [Desulforamulus aquiferis]RYD03686.1 hypothetical protein N752_18225 [Desulforamulus aquiferis]